MAGDRDRIAFATLKRLFARLRPDLAPFRGSLLLASLAMIGATALEILRPWPMKLIFDGLLIPAQEPDALTQRAIDLTGGGNGLLAAASLSILLIAVVGGLLAFAQSYLIASVGQKVVAKIRLRLYRHIQRLSHSFHDQASTGDLLSRLTGDVRMMRDLLVNAIVYLSARILVIAGTMTIMFLMDWRLTLAALVVLPGLFFVSNRFAFKIRGAARKQRRKEGKIAAVVGESISAITVVKGFAREAHEEARFAKQNNSSLRAGLVATKLEGHMDRIVQVLLAVGSCIVLWYGVHRIQDGAITPGDLLVFVAYLTALYKPIRKLAAMTSRVAKATASGERLLEIFELTADVKESEDAIMAPRFNGEIRLEDVTFSYRGGDTVLRRCDVTIAAGQTVVLLGESGAGKSTIGKLLLRFYDPDAGHIHIDGTDIRQFTLDSLREQVAVVLQESVLFAASVRDNIAYGRLGASFEEVVQAARIAGADAFIRCLPEGYDTVLGERGATLSGGQRQRIAIARAVIRDAPILIFDEPLTGLDTKTAAGVADALASAAAGRTTLMITHDPSAVTWEHRTVALRDGKIVDDPEEPPARSLRFA